MAVTSTQSVHAGEARFRSHDSLTVPIVQTAVYTFDSCQALAEFTEERMFWDEPEREEYGRYGNPTVRAAEAKLAALEGGEDAILVGSGMAAITSTLLLLLGAGDHLILTEDAYHSTLDFCHRYLGGWGIQHTVVPCGDYQAMSSAVQANTKVIFAESPTNPFMRCLDIRLVAELAHSHSIKTVVDSTFATPYNQQPLSLGADLVIHSVTKYLGGHNDLMGGAVIGSAALTTPLRQMQGLLGHVPAPQTAWLVLRGLKTLALRMAQHNANGLAVARYLEDHPRVRRVWYPGLPSHPDHTLAAAMRGHGGVVSFEVEGDAETAYRVINALRIPSIGPSLGGVESMVSPLALMGYANVPPEERLRLGIRDELIRLCCGIEETADLIADLAQALDQA